MSEVLASSQRLRAAAVEVLVACGGCCTGQALRTFYDKILEEPVPEAIQEQMRKLDQLP